MTGTGLKAMTALTTDLNGPGINLSGFLGSLKIGHISGGADIRMGAPPTTIKRPAARITAGIISNGTDITVAGAPLAALLATSIGDGTITAPSVGTITAKGKAKTRLAAAIPGDFNADVVVSGAGVLPTKNALTKLRAAGSVTGSTVTVTGNVGAISVGGRADGVVIDVTGNVKSATFGQFWNSRLDAGYTGPNNGSGTFDLESTVGTFKVTSKTNGFARSDVVAASFGNVALASVDPTVTGTKFGFAYHMSLRALSVRAPAFRFDPAGAVVQGMSSSDFEVRKA